MQNASLRAVGASDLDVARIVVVTDADPPRVAADLAVLDERAMDERIDVDFDFFAAIRTDDGESLVHVIDNCTRGSLDG